MRDRIFPPESDHPEISCFRDLVVTRPVSMVMEETTTLASLLGRQAKDPINPHPVFPVTVDWLKSSPKEVNETTSTEDETEMILAELIDPSKVKTVVQFNKTCKKFLEINCTSELQLSVRTSAAGMILANVTDRCAGKKQKRFWPQKSLLRIIEQCQVAASSCSTFISLAMDMNEVDIVRCCMEHMQDIPDAVLAKCLQFYIRHFEGESLSGSQKTTNDGTTAPSTTAPSIVCPVSSHCTQCINKVLCSPFNDTFIIDNLRQFSFDEAMILLRYFHYLLSTTQLSEQDDCIPTLNMLADWISALLDAHYTQMILSHEARDLLASLAETVQTQALIFTELEAVQTILDSFKAVRTIPAKPKAGSYSIEFLSM